MSSKRCFLFWPGGRQFFFKPDKISAAANSKGEAGCDGTAIGGSVEVAPNSSTLLRLAGEETAAGMALTLGWQ